MNIRKFLFVVFMVTGLVAMSFSQTIPIYAAESVKDTELPPFLLANLLVNVTQASVPDTDYNTSTYGWQEDFADGTEFSDWDQTNINTTVVAGGNATITLQPGNTTGSVFIQLGNGTFTQNINRYVFQSIEAFLPNKTATSNQFILKTDTGLYNSSAFTSTGYIKFHIHTNFFPDIPANERITGVGLRINGDGVNANATTVDWIRIYNTFAGVEASDDSTSSSTKVKKINFNHGTFEVQLSARTQTATITPVTVITTSSGEVVISAVGESITKEATFPIFIDGVRVAQSDEKGAKISWESVEREKTTLVDLLKDLNVQMVQGDLTQERTLFDPRVEKVGAPKVKFVRLEPSRKLDYSKFIVGSDHALTVFQWTLDALGIDYQHIIYINSISQKIEHEIPYNEFEGSRLSLTFNGHSIKASPSVTVDKQASTSTTTTTYTEPPTRPMYTGWDSTGYMDPGLRNALSNVDLEPDPIETPPPPPKSAGLYDVSEKFVDLCTVFCEVGNTAVKAVQTLIEGLVEMQVNDDSGDVNPLPDSQGHKTSISPDIKVESDIAQDVDRNILVPVLVGVLIIVVIGVVVILLMSRRKGRRTSES